MEQQTAPFLVVGLGNPGREHRETRHNVGFMVIDRICKTAGISITKVQLKALVGLGQIDGGRVVLAKPQTYMNTSGQSVGGLMRFYKIPLPHLIVAHDDLDLPFGALRLRPEGGSAGQKGMESIIQHLGSQEFTRLRVGIGRPPGQMDPAAYVLQAFQRDELILLDRTLDRAVAAVKVFMNEGINQAMNLFNGLIEEK